MTNGKEFSLEHLYSLLLTAKEKPCDASWNAILAWREEIFGKLNDALRGANCDNYYSVDSIMCRSVWECIWDSLVVWFDCGTVDQNALCALIDRIDLYFENIKKPLLERELTDAEKTDILIAFEEDGVIDRITDGELQVYRRVALEFCEKKNCLGLEAVGYGAYGGNRAFECDFALSEKCMLNLLSASDSISNQAFYANTLGYIYYYGRTTDGVPRYDEALRYFSFAALGGVYEAKYKLADMYQNGYGGIKSLALARSIIDELYADNIKYMQAGNFNCKFADIALRRGALVLPVDGEELFKDITPMLGRALKYYAEAQFAIRMRMEVCNYYGDAKVAGNIDTAIRETKEKLGFAPKKSLYFYSLDELIADNLAGGRKIILSVKTMKKGYKLIFRAVKSKNEVYEPRLLLSFPEIEMCGLYDKLSVYTTADGEELERGDYIFDRVEENGLYLGDECVCELPYWSRYTVKALRGSEREYRFASVRFNGYGRTYDYLCDSESIGAGDEVLVDTYAGETVCRVERIAVKKENELSLPLKRYKRIKGLAK